MKYDVANALTIDVEDAVNQAMRNFFNTEMEPTIRVFDNTMRLLDLFSEYETRATFFILGEVAETFPGLIKEISGRGHELGIHGYSHARYHNLTKKEAREEIVRAKRVVEDITGIEVAGHRAPEFSINKETLWVMEILIDEGIKYDSSIFPASSGRYGWPGFEKDIHWLTLDNGRRIIEAPLSTATYFGKTVPACGGGYLRAFPYLFTSYAFNKIIKQRPVNVYLHPYEIDLPPFQKFYMDEIRKSALRHKVKLKTYWFNRKSVIPKLRRLLETYKFDTMRNVIEDALKIRI